MREDVKVVTESLEKLSDTMLSGIKASLDGSMEGDKLLLKLCAGIIEKLLETCARVKALEMKVVELQKKEKEQDARLEAHSVAINKYYTEFFTKLEENIH